MPLFSLASVNDGVYINAIVYGGKQMADVVFKTQGAAEHFLRLAAPSQLGGCGFWSSEKWISRATAMAKAIIAQEPKPWHTPGVERVAMIMRSYRKGGARFLGVRCDCCGTILSAPESVAAGRGPSCMARMAS
jgi:hypothetical protein